MMRVLSLYVGQLNNQAGVACMPTTNVCLFGNITCLFVCYYHPNEEYGKQNDKRNMRIQRHDELTQGGAKSRYIPA